MVDIYPNNRLMAAPLKNVKVAVVPDNLPNLFGRELIRKMELNIDVSNGIQEQKNQGSDYLKRLILPFDLGKNTKGAQ